MYVSGTYFASWSIYQHKHFVTDLPVADITHVFYAFMKIDSNTGEVQLGDSWGDAEIPLESPCGGLQVKGSLGQLYELKKKRRYLKTLMSIGGWGTKDTFVAAFLNPQKMDTFVKSAVTMANCYHFDGIDIDWEYPSNDAEARQLVEVLSRLRAALGPSRLLSVACPGGDDALAILRPHLSAMDKSLSFWNVMCYDYAGKSWSGTTGFHSNLFGHNGDNLMCSDSIITNYLEAGASRNKLVLGMPAYARCFASPAQPSIGQPFNKSTGPDDLQYKEIPEKDEQFDHRKVSAFAVDKSRGLLLTYDSPLSARIKAKYVELKKLAGGMWWCSYGDQPGERSLVGAFVDQLGRSNLDHTNNYV